MIVEDEPGFRAGLRRMLIQRGYEGVTASDGGPGRRAAQDTPLDPILLGGRVPGRAGLQALQLIRGAQPAVHFIMHEPAESLNTNVTAGEAFQPGLAVAGRSKRRASISICL